MRGSWSWPNRRGAAEAELHDATNHTFIIVEGEATFVTGGKLVEPRTTGRGQVRAKAIEGGESHELRKGDVITIPAKTPHWWKESGPERLATTRSTSRSSGLRCATSR